MGHLALQSLSKAQRTKSQSWNERDKIQAEVHIAAPPGGVATEQLAVDYDLSATTLRTGLELLVLE